jgi:hypothetical protein
VTGPSPEQNNRYRLLVRSIGRADAAVLGALRRVRPAPDIELANILYRAPAELVSGLDLDIGTRLRDILLQTGVDVELTPAGEPFEPGVGEYEVALVIRRFDRIMEIVEATSRIMGIPADAAMKILWATPAVLLGGVSLATVEALRARFAKLGVEVDASRTATARFDIAVEVSDESTRQLLQMQLRENNVTATRSGPNSYLATDIESRAATRIWEQLSRTSASSRVLNRDFERFDVRLDTAPTSADAAEWLVSVTGMPTAVAGTALGKTPFVLAESVPLETMVSLLEGAHARGGQASAVLLPLQSFSLRVKEGGDRKAALQWVELIAGPQDVERFVRGKPEMHGPFTKTQARWLQAELRRHEIASHLLER